MKIYVGTEWNVKVIHIDDKGIVVKSDSEESTYLHKTTWGNRTKDSFSIGQSLRIEKTGFDKEHDKHVWKILEDSTSDTVPLTQR